MDKFISTSADTPKTRDDDPRIGHLLGKDLRDGDPPRAALIGFPGDEGVRRNGGRPGAAAAPDEIRRHLFKMTPPSEGVRIFTELAGHTADMGNLAVTGNVEQDQEALGRVVSGLLEEGTVPIILGGGHETAYGHFLGYTAAKKELSVFNLDAHADVRGLKDGKAHSGSPFRQAMEHESGICRMYAVAGLQPHSVAQSHLEYIVKQQGAYLYRDETDIAAIRKLLEGMDTDRTMVTFDMDAVDQAWAPGVSAPCSHGLTPDLWLRVAYEAGKNRRVTSFDLSEVNPQFDRDGQTVRLAGLTVWHFLLGLSRRKNP